jgi:hypothetical protein
MTVAALAGLGSGALHAVAGPDHLLSLVHLSMRGRRRAWRVGLLWGLGHALGTLVCSAVVFGVAAALDLRDMQEWGDRMAGAALVLTGVMGLRRRIDPVPVGAPAPGAATARGALVIGLVHGLTGTGAVLMVLPALASASPSWQWVYLGGFAFGSTLAMAALTAALAAGSGVLARRGALVQRVPRVASAGSVLLGGCWLLA